MDGSFLQKFECHGLRVSESQSERKSREREGERGIERERERGRERVREGERGRERERGGERGRQRERGGERGREGERERGREKCQRRSSEVLSALLFFSHRLRCALTCLLAGQPFGCWKKEKLKSPCGDHESAVYSRVLAFV